MASSTLRSTAQPPDGIHRRAWLRTAAGVAIAGATSTAIGRSKPVQAAPARPSDGSNRGIIFKAVKIGMIQTGETLTDKFQVLKDLGFDGVELNSPSAIDPREAVAASRQVGLPIHGTVDGIHWKTRFSDPDPAVRSKAFEGLQTAITQTHALGGSAVLLVPGKVTDPQEENHDQVWSRSMAGIRKAIPLAARLGVRILVENVWNGFCYQPDGPNDQTADMLARYLDEIDSPWVGSYFDIGNHIKYARPAEWIRTLGHRIVKLDVKDFTRPGQWSDIGSGDADWPAVRAALKEIGFAGWATAEVRGGGRDRLEQIAQQMDQVLGL